MFGAIQLTVLLLPATRRGRMRETGRECEDRRDALEQTAFLMNGVFPLCF